MWKLVPYLASCKYTSLIHASVTRSSTPIVRRSFHWKRAIPREGIPVSHHCRLPTKWEGTNPSLQALPLRLGYRPSPRTNPPTTHYPESLITTRHPPRTRQLQHGPNYLRPFPRGTIKPVHRTALENEIGKARNHERIARQDFLRPDLGKGARCATRLYPRRIYRRCLLLRGADTH